MTTKFRSLLLFLLLLAAPAPLLAQQGPSDRDNRRGPPRHGPVEMLLRDRAEIRLTDDQVARLQVIGKRMEETNRPLVAELWRIRRETKLPSRLRPEEMTPAQREVYQSHLEQARPFIEQIHDNNRAAMKEVGEVLTAEQKTKLRQMLKARESREREEKQKGGDERSGHRDNGA